MAIKNLPYNSPDSLTNTRLNEVITQLNDGIVLSQWQILDVFTDTTLQSGAPIDTPKTVIYGASKQDPLGYIDYNGTTGEFTILKGGTFGIKTRIRAGRQSATGTTQMYFWAEISVDGGNTWQITGQTIDVRLRNANDTRIFFDYAWITLPAGVMLRSRFARSSTGSDFGDLTPSTPSTALQALGVTDSPSAQLTVYYDPNRTYT